MGGDRDAFQDFEVPESLMQVLDDQRGLRHRRSFSKNTAFAAAMQAFGPPPSPWGHAPAAILCGLAPGLPSETRPRLPGSRQETVGINQGFRCCGDTVLR